MPVATERWAAAAATDYVTTGMALQYTAATGNLCATAEAMAARLCLLFMKPT